jgi:hypothetical protein
MRGSSRGGDHWTISTSHHWDWHFRIKRTIQSTQDAPTFDSTSNRSGIASRSRTRRNSS